MPTGVRMPVESMSRRALIGIVQALLMPGSCKVVFISAMSSSSVMRSRQNGRRKPLSHSGAQPEYQRGCSRHSDSGLRRTVVSIIENGAGSVEVSARPALPKTRATSGKVMRSLSCTWSAFCASATDIPGCTADGM
jgi:hypothetical protein